MIRGRGALNRPQSLCVQTSRRSVTDCCLKRTRSERRSVLPKATPAGADRANCKVGWPVTLFEQGMSPRWTSGIATTWLGPAPFPATSELCGQAQIRLARGGQARSSPVKPGQAQRLGSCRPMARSPETGTKLLPIRFVCGGGWPGGIAPPGSLMRDGLPSHGSNHPVPTRRSNSIGQDTEPRTANARTSAGHRVPCPLVTPNAFCGRCVNRFVFPAGPSH